MTSDDDEQSDVEKLVEQSDVGACFHHEPSVKQLLLSITPSSNSSVKIEYEEFEVYNVIDVSDALPQPSPDFAMIAYEKDAVHSVSVWCGQLCGMYTRCAHTA